MSRARDQLEAIAAIADHQGRGITIHEQAVAEYEAELSKYEAIRKDIENVLDAAHKDFLAKRIYYAIGAKNPRLSINRINGLLSYLGKVYPYCHKLRTIISIRKRSIAGLQRSIQWYRQYLEQAGYYQSNPTNADI